MSTFEIRDEEIDVEKIMERIRKNIKKRRQQKGYYEAQRLLQEPGFKPQESGLESDELRASLWPAKMAYQVQVRRPILSYRRFVSGLVVRIRRILQQEIRWTVDPIVDRQEYFNRLIVRSLNVLVESVERLQKGQAQTDHDWNRLPMDYVSFEERYRGNSEEIKRRLTVYVDYFKRCSKVVDIGCGRGEFLELLKENGIGAFGVDMNDDMVEVCLKKGLDVKWDDALSYLRSLADGYLDGIFSAHLIEHLTPVDLLEFIRLCSAKLRSGAYFIAETPNPLSLSTFATAFYVDLSHVKPVHPKTMQFLLDTNRFKEIEFRFSQPWPEDMRLNLFETSSIKDLAAIRLLEKLNQNFAKLNDLLFGCQDYAVIARKI